MKTVEQRKKEIERIFSSIGVKPVHRTKINGDEVFIADGFLPPSQVSNGNKRFGIMPGEYPYGVFATLWWTERFKGIGSVIFCDAFHDPGYSPADKQQMRVNVAVHLAQKDFEKLRQVH